MKSVWLAARSALGTTDGVPAREVFRGAGLSIVEEDFLPIHSLRRSRAAHDETWLSRTLASVGLELPEAPRAQSGNATRACVHIEPKDRKSTRLNSSHQSASRMPSAD